MKNSAQLRVKRLAWGTQGTKDFVENELLEGHLMDYDLIMASDVLYDPEVHA